ncbi:hypothetical protein [Fontibacillus phaseoli]|uniref:hypothetical protein n=1 Tax=Fontibacillus phaseoli TaxID=1416533 RepID=UPI0011C04199|nr:hypothetical protein [Fontibacillus phaseoli]
MNNAVATNSEGVILVTIKEKLGILNSIEIVDYDADGSTLYHAVVENTFGNQQKLKAIGITDDEIEGAFDEEGNIDIKDFAFERCGAKWFHEDFGGFIDYIPK